MRKLRLRPIATVLCLALVACNKSPNIAGKWVFEDSMLSFSKDGVVTETILPSNDTLGQFRWTQEDSLMRWAFDSGEEVEVRIVSLEKSTLVLSIDGYNLNLSKAKEKTEPNAFQRWLRTLRPHTVNGYKYADLGLSVKWATCNIGADSPSDYGDYFFWGDIHPKQRHSDCPTEDVDLWCIAGNPAYDAARANWGGSWRMPTIDEIVELNERCIWVGTTRDDRFGYLVTGPNGNSIFLPAAGAKFEDVERAGSEGCYWSAMPHKEYSWRAYGLSFKSGEHIRNGWARSAGLSIRPVTE